MDDVSELREYLAERSHIGWMAERQSQGFADHVYRGEWVGDTPYVQCSTTCALPQDKHHPDMVPYADLPEHVKAYDRRTVDGVLAGIEAAGYRIVKANE